MTTIYLVRHGQASFGAESYDKLSSLGEEQAKYLGQFLGEILKEMPLVVAGSMQRHQQTASFSLNECFTNTNIEIDSKWNEFNHEEVLKIFEPKFGQPELLKAEIAKEKSIRDYLGKIFGGAIERWTSGHHDADYSETWLQFQSRVLSALEQLCQKVQEQQPKYAVVYTSGGVISAVTGHLLGLSTEKTFALNWAIANASMTTIKLVDGQPELLSLNEHQFIKEKDSKLLTWI